MIQLNIQKNAEALKQNMNTYRPGLKNQCSVITTWYQVQVQYCMCVAFRCIFIFRGNLFGVKNISCLGCNTTIICSRHHFSCIYKDSTKICNKNAKYPDAFLVIFKLSQGSLRICIPSVFLS